MKKRVYIYIRTITYYCTYYSHTLCINNYDQLIIRYIIYLQTQTWMEANICSTLGVRTLTENIPYPVFQFVPPTPPRRRGFAPAQCDPKQFTNDGDTHLPIHRKAMYSIVSITLELPTTINLMLFSAYLPQSILQDEILKSLPTTLPTCKDLEIGCFPLNSSSIRSWAEPNCAWLQLNSISWKFQ